MKNYTFKQNDFNRNESTDGKSSLCAFQFHDDFNPETIPPRDWIVKGLLLKPYVSVLVGPGGVGKSQLINTVGVSLASGIDFLNLGVKEQYNVLIINNEDSEDELKMRVSGICQHHNISFNKISDSLFMHSGYSEPLILADNSNDMIKATKKKDELIALIKQKNISILTVDAFVSSHNIDENRNSDMDKVIGVYKSIALETNIAILIVHHTRKMGSDSEAHAGDIESSRGAKAVTDACRAGHTLASMSRKTAKELDIDFSIGKSLLRMDDAKQNYSELNERSSWFRMVSTQIANEEWIGVPEMFNIEPHLKNLRDKSNGLNPHDVAESLNSICIHLANPDENTWTEIRSKYMELKKVSTRTAMNHIKLLSDNPENPTRINSDTGLIDFWIGQKSGGSTAPFVIFRKEL